MTEIAPSQSNDSGIGESPKNEENPQCGCKCKNGSLYCPLSSKTTKFHMTVLDGLANVNATFTFAVFLGFSLTTPAMRKLQWIMFFEVLSFSFFFSSIIIAKALMYLIYLRHGNGASQEDVDIGLLRKGIMNAGWGFMCGCICLFISIFFIIHIRLGTLFSTPMVYATAVFIFCSGRTLVSVLCLLGQSSTNECANPSSKNRITSLHNFLQEKFLTVTSCVFLYPMVPTKKAKKEQTSDLPK